MCQQNLGFRNLALLGWLFCINTVGSETGAVVASGSMIPLLGLPISMVTAATLDILARLDLDVLGAVGSRHVGDRRVPTVCPDGDTMRISQHVSSDWFPGTADMLAMGLGFYFLAYEMYLFRLMPLMHLPLPFMFAAVLTGFLAFWSLGAALSSWKRGPRLAGGLRLCAAGCFLSIALAALEWYALIHGTGALLEFVVRETSCFTSLHSVWLSVYACDEDRREVLGP